MAMAMKQVGREREVNRNLSTIPYTVLSIYAMHALFHSLFDIYLPMHPLHKRHKIDKKTKVNDGLDSYAAIETVHRLSRTPATCTANLCRNT